MENINSPLRCLRCHKINAMLCFYGGNSFLFNSLYTKMLSFLLEELGNFGLEQCFFYRKAGNSASVTWNFLFGFISNTSVLLGGASLADRLSYLFFSPLAACDCRGAVLFSLCTLIPLAVELRSVIMITN